MKYNHVSSQPLIASCQDQRLIFKCNGYFGQETDVNESLEQKETGSILNQGGAPEMSPNLGDSRASDEGGASEPGDSDTQAGSSETPVLGAAHRELPRSTADIQVQRLLRLKAVELLQLERTRIKATIDKWGGGHDLKCADSKSPGILSPSILDFPVLMLSPVTPAINEEDRAIADKKFYFHPSPLTASEPPQLLLLMMIVIIVDILPRIAALEPRLRAGGTVARAGAAAGDGFRVTFAMFGEDFGKAMHYCDCTEQNPSIGKLVSFLRWRNYSLQ
ncbi:hypothetical protein SASPL_112284 [Salvia splendens]|uniref:Uncharacterized protein n=1 Tax=Salvia splendens TaxID=180675 RepID=A0A8X9A548_SALSN|nr:hypothetical protein SASPL_112284 [Salvia splendens]